MSDLYAEILRDVRALVAQQAGGRGSIQVSKEVAALLGARVATPDDGGRASTADWENPGVYRSGAALVANAAEGDASRGDVAGALEALRAAVAGCAKCGLCGTRTQTVFSDGNPNADLVFVGEAPGADEDRQGVPFVGAAGRLLTDIIEKGMKLRREDVYICNILKCRPPGNRDPNPDEIEQCEPYLIQQLALVRPKVICCLGRFAAHTLLKTTTPLNRLRGTWHEYQGIPLRVTYHPSYILHQRDPEQEKDAKRKTWQDVQEVMKLLNGGVSP